jgi:LysM repeat protein
MESFVGSAHRHGRKVKLMRSGRHTQPSQVEKVAEKAGKAAPVMAISAGALVAVPHGHAVAPAKHTTTAEAVTTAKTQHDTSVSAVSVSQALATAKATHASSISLDAARQNQAHVAKAAHTAQAGHDYTVRSGDTLSRIASQAYGKAGDWQWLYHENSPKVSDPNEIYPDQVLKVPADPPANYTLPSTTSSAGYQARHAKPVRSSASEVSSSSSSSSHRGSSATVSDVSHSAPATSHGAYSCSGLEGLWEEAGGSSGTAFMAAEIAMAESGGNPNAVSPTDDFGLWQINGSHGSMATLDPLGNARAAVSISGGGSSWGAWTTYTTGAYAGRC